MAILHSDSFNGMSLDDPLWASRNMDNALGGSGTPLDVTSDGSCSAFYGRVANCGSLPDYQNGWDYLPNSRMVMRMMQMVGTTGLSTARSGVDSAFSANDATEGPAAAKYRAATAFATV